MSLNQLTASGSKNWLIAKTFDLTVDGDIKLTNPNSRAGDILTCTSEGVAEFVPPHIVPSLPLSFYNLDSGGNQVIPSIFNITAVPGYPSSNFTLTPPNLLTCTTAGIYWVTKKITRNAPNNGGVRSNTLLNSVVYNPSVLAMQQTTNGLAGAGLTNSYLMQLAVGDTIQEAFSIYGTSYQNDQTRPTTNIQFVKIG